MILRTTRLIGFSVATALAALSMGYDLPSALAAGSDPARAVIRAHDDTWLRQPIRVIGQLIVLDIARLQAPGNHEPELLHDDARRVTRIHPKHDRFQARDR